MSNIQTISNENIDDIYNYEFIKLDTLITNENIDKIFSDPNVRQNIKHLDCHGCSEITYIPILPNLKYLNCSMTPIKYLSSYENLEKLECNSCEILEHIDTMPSLLKLKCCDCYILKTIPIMPKLEYLNCQKCYMLTIITDLPMCNYIACQMCYNIETIENIPSITILRVDDCVKLCKLPDLNNLIGFTCDRCDKLNKYSVPVKFCMQYLEYDELIKYLEYNPYNINYILNNIFRIQHMISILKNRPEFLEYANKETTDKCMRLMSQNNLLLPLLVKNCYK